MIKEKLQVAQSCLDITGSKISAGCINIIYLWNLLDARHQYINESHPASDKTQFSSRKRYITSIATPYKFKLSYY